MSMTTGMKLHEMRKPSEKDYGFIDMISCSQLSTLRYYFVHEEQTKKCFDDAFVRIESLLRMSLSGNEKATAAFHEAVGNLKENTLNTSDSITELNVQYSEIVERHIEKCTDSPVLTQISSEDLDYILTLVHDRNIENIESLNEYKPWTAEVYGETSYEFAKSMLDDLKIGHDDQFLDLGSGVGRVVMQVSALYHCKKSVGIELMGNRAKFAEGMDIEFRSIMAWLGKAHGDYQLIHGDFRRHRDIINQSNVIFCNNFAFEEKLNFELKSIFADKLPEKVRILVSKSLRDEKFRITEKTASDGAAVLPVRRTFQGKMSWTDNPVTFYLHEVDSTTLARFTESRKDPNKRAIYEEEQRQLRPKYYESSSEQSQDMDPDLTEEETHQNPISKRGCTTRSQWRTSVKRRRVANDNTESDDDSDNSNSDASTQRTRSIPSQDSGTRSASKKKRGRPIKFSARSAPSSASDSALQALFAHTVKSITGIDRSAQPGCTSDKIGLLACADLPAEYRACLQSIEAAMRRHWRSVQAHDYPAQLENRMNLDQVKLDQLKESQKRLQCEVNALRMFCKKLLEAMFSARRLRLPSSADELSRESREMLQTTNLLRERNNTLKDDIYWLENAHNSAKSQLGPGIETVNGRYSHSKMAASYQVNGNFTGFGPVQSLDFHPSTKHNPTSFTNTAIHPGLPSSLISNSGTRFQTNSSGKLSHHEHDFVKPNAQSSDSTDLRNAHKTISHGPPSFSQGLEASKEPPYRSATTNILPNSKGNIQNPGGHTFMSELGRVIESSLRGPSREAMSNSGKNEMPCSLSSKPHQESSQSRGKSANVHMDSPRQYQTATRLPAPSQPSSVQTSPFAAAVQSDLVTRQYPSAVVHGQIVYPGIVGVGQPYQQTGMYADYAPLQNYAFQPDARQLAPTWTNSSLHFDPSQIAAGAFCGMPGSGVGVTQRATPNSLLKLTVPQQQQTVGFEAISPPPR